MKEWFTAREIAEANLPDLPRTESAVVRLADRENWHSHPAYSRPRKGRGGGVEFSLRVLPVLAQIEWSRRHFVVGAELEHVDSAAAQTGAPDTRHLTDRALRERDARLAIVQSFERWQRGLDQRLNKDWRLQNFALKYEMGSLQVEPWVKELVPSFSARTLQRWCSVRKAGAVDELAVDRALSRKGTGVLESANGGRVRDFILAMLARNAHLSGEHMRTLCRDEFGDTLTVRGSTKQIPPVRAFQRTIAALKQTHRVELTKLTNPDLYRSTMAPSGTGTYRHIDEPNALWMIDASPVDALCVDGRHAIYACIDIATRRVVFSLSRTPRAAAVALLLRKAILTWGKPQRIKTDNGSDFVARDTKRLLAALDIELEVSDAYSPQQKGHVERVIRTFQHGVGPLLPGFIGHSVEDRKAIESRRSFAQRLGESDADTFGVELTASALQAHVDQWVEQVYHQHPHAGIGGKTPFNVAAESRHPVATVDERALDLLLMPVAGKDGRRVVTKFGIRIEDFHYASHLLMPGQAVFVRQDPLERGRVYAFSADEGRFLAEAICPELKGISPATFHQARRELVAEHMADVTRQIKADIKAMGKEPLIERALRVAARDMPNVVALPKRQEPHTNDRIEAALAAMADTPAPAEEASSQPAVQRLEPLPSNVTPLRTHETPHQRFARALDIERRLAAGEAIDARDAGWLEGYRTGVEYGSLRRIYEESEGSMSL